MATCKPGKVAHQRIPARPHESSPMIISLSNFLCLLHSSKAMIGTPQSHPSWVFQPLSCVWLYFCVILPVPRDVVISIPSSMSCTLTSFHHAASHVQLLRPHLWWNCSRQFCRKKKTHFYQRRYSNTCHPRDKAPTQPSFNCCINNSTFQSAVP